MRQEQRQYPRTPIALSVLLTFENGQTLKVDTWDISDGGIGIHFPTDHDIAWVEGLTLSAQVQGLPIEGPVLPMKVARITDDRIGLKLA